MGSMDFSPRTASGGKSMVFCMDEVKTLERVLIL